MSIFQPRHLLFWICAIAFYLIINSSSALVNTPEDLILHAGESISLSGEIQKTRQIKILAGATVEVVPADGTPENSGMLNLVAPEVFISGTIAGDGVSTNTMQAGRGPWSSGNAGGGGGGYGGKGGAGEDGVWIIFTVIGGAGGGTYDASQYFGEAGSKGFNAGYLLPRAGYGGANIQIDAITLTLAATAMITARGYTTPMRSVGGGSGGAIVLRAGNLLLQAGSSLDVSGGVGSSEAYDSGGGGGGRIKLIRYDWLSNMGANLITAGGHGGPAANDGLSGNISIPDPPVMNAPVLLGPENGSEVGVAPTLEFSASDPAASKFLIFRVEFSRYYDFSPVEKIYTQSDGQSEGVWPEKFSRSGDRVTFSVAADHPLIPGIVYYWRVSVSRNRGASWLTSPQIRTFLTTPTNNGRPHMPQLIAPVNGDMHVGSTPSFIIRGSDPDAGDVLTFSLLLSKDSAFSSPVVFGPTYAGWQQNNVSTPASVECRLLNTETDKDALIPGVQYYWKAICNDNFAQASESPIFGFITLDRPSEPVALWPQNNAIATTKTPEFKVVSEAFPNQPPTELQYKLELSHDNFETVWTFLSERGNLWDNPNNQAYEPGQIATMRFPLEYSLMPGQTYAWKVSALDVIRQNWSAAANTHFFTVFTPPIAVELLAPEQRFEAPNPALVFQVRAVSEAGTTLTAKIEIADNDAFTPLIVSADQSLSSLHWSAPFFASQVAVSYALPTGAGLKRGKTYFWRAQAFDGYSWSDFSPVNNFHIVNTMNLQELKIIPNPVVCSQQATVFLKASTDAQATFYFYNALGKEVKQISMKIAGGPQGNACQITISDFASGAYTLRVILRSPLGKTERIKQFAVVK
jgi:hypothetical protein